MISFIHIIMLLCKFVWIEFNKSMKIKDQFRIDFADFVCTVIVINSSYGFDIFGSDVFLDIRLSRLLIKKHFIFLSIQYF